MLGDAQQAILAQRLFSSEEKKSRRTAILQEVSLDQFAGRGELKQLLMASPPVNHDHRALLLWDNPQLTRYQVIAEADRMGKVGSFRRQNRCAEERRQFLSRPNHGAWITDKNYFHKSEKIVGNDEG